MFATCPPGRTSSVQSSKLWGTPTASMATSAPSPSVRDLTISTASSLPLFTVTSAPNRLAASSRVSARSMAMIVPGGEQLRAH